MFFLEHNEIYKFIAKQSIHWNKTQYLRRRGKPWSNEGQVQDHQRWQTGDIILQQSDLPHSSVVLLGNPSETGTEGEEGERKKRRERRGREVEEGRRGVTYQASVHSSGSACVGLEGHRWPYPQRACCDREEAEEGVHFGSSHQGPWAFEWAAAGAQHRHKNTHQLARKHIWAWAIKRENSRNKQIKAKISVQNVMIK